MNARLQPAGTVEPLDIATLRTGLPSLALRVHPDQQTVLCVDNDSKSHPLLRTALADYHIVVVSSAYDALRNINTRVFDLYVLEYWFHDWAGVSLCRAIRKVDPNVPVCFWYYGCTAEGAAACITRRSKRLCS